MIGAGIGAFSAGALAGSFTASCGAVKAGAMTTLAMLKAGGIGATGYMIYDNLKNALIYTPHVFWSGGDMVKGASQTIANNVGGTTLEMTKLGQYLTSKDASYNTWLIASQNFANQVPNGATVYSVQNPDGVRLLSAWATVEFPSLVNKAVEIIYKILGWM